MRSTLGIAMLMVVLLALDFSPIPESQEVCFEGIYMTTSSMIGYFNYTDLYLWSPYVSIEGVLLNHNSFGGVLNISLVYNNIVVAQDQKVVMPNSSTPFYLSANLSNFGVYSVSTYSIIVSLSGLSDNRLLYACTLVKGAVYVSGYNWPVSVWSNSTTQGITVSVMPSIITNNVASPPQIYVYATGLAPLKIYEIEAVYPNIPNNPIHLSTIGSGAYGDLYTTITLPVVTNTSSISIIVYDPATNTSYSSTIWQLTLPSPPRTCVQGIDIGLPSGTLITPVKPTTTTATNTTTATTITKTVTSTTTLTSTWTTTQTLYINSTTTNTVTVTTTVIQNSTLTQTLIVGHNSTQTTTQTIVSTSTVENPILSQASRAASMLASTGYVVVIGFLALTTAVAASISILAHRPLFKTIKRVEEEVGRRIPRKRK
uniref:Uncharacterized protein n=1 Tax=Thermogladius calderae TaxID=1200300 RepID=A0A7J3Y047_9CREN